MFGVLSVVGRELDVVPLDLHHGAWWLYYRSGAQQLRKRISTNREEAERIAAEVNAQIRNDARARCRASDPRSNGPFGDEDRRKKLIRNITKRTQIGDFGIEQIWTTRVEEVIDDSSPIRVVAMTKSVQIGYRFDQ